MIKAVFFDIDDTLFTFEKAHAAAMPSLCRYAWEQLGIDPEAFAFAYNDQYRRMAEEIGPQAAIHNRMIRFLRILKENGKPLSFAPVLNDLYWNAVLAAGGPEPGAPECIRSLRQKGYILGVASNMTLDWQMRKLETIGVLPYFTVSSPVRKREPKSRTSVFLTYVSDMPDAARKNVSWWGTVWNWTFWAPRTRVCTRCGTRSRISSRPTRAFPTIPS